MFILIVPLLRAIVGIVMRGFADLVRTPSDAPTKQSGRPEVPVAGDLKKDPVCGTYVSTATSLKRTAAGQTVYFCSQACLDRYRG